MSRIGKKPIPLGAATVTVAGQTVTTKGKLGELTFVLHEDVSVEIENGEMTVVPKDDSRRARAMWGMTRSVLASHVHGVSSGFAKTLELVGVGYRAAMKGAAVELSLGYSHPVVFNPPKGITIACTKPTEIVISGYDPQAVGQVAAEIRSKRPPEPYKGKGVKYQGERIRRKEGKKK
jgi:large subunit ribosomal protein L6